mmetsp:Transcript_7394/g.6553  ORF Transcript_7394/g.6553 Transcript_7394/m.6553 type:complete len:170 (-) Transcript_7394:37-546(-)
MPKERYSKLPNSQKLMSITEKVVKHRDPRFIASETNPFNKGLFEASYKFVDDMAKQRKRDIKRQLRVYKKKTNKNKELTSQETDTQKSLIGILAEESNLIKVKNMSTNSAESKYLKQAKDMNKERAKKGLNPIYYKKRELKEMKYKEQFEKLEKKGKVDREISKAMRKL